MLLQFRGSSGTAAAANTALRLKSAFNLNAQNKSRPFGLLIYMKRAIIGGQLLFYISLIIP